MFHMNLWTFLECVCTESNFTFLSFAAIVWATFHVLPHFYYSFFVPAMKHMDFQYSSDFFLYNLDDLEDAITCGEGGRGEVGGNEIMGFLKLTAFVCLQNQNVLKGKAVVGGFLIQFLGSA